MNFEIMENLIQDVLGGFAQTEDITIENGADLPTDLRGIKVSLSFNIDDVFKYNFYKIPKYRDKGVNQKTRTRYLAELDNEVTRANLEFKFLAFYLGKEALKKIKQRSSVNKETGIYFLRRIKEIKLGTLGDIHNYLRMKGSDYNYAQHDLSEPYFHIILHDYIIFEHFPKKMHASAQPSPITIQDILE